MEISPTQNHTVLSSHIPRKPIPSQESPLSANPVTEEQVQLASLRKRDQEVRTHEQTHLAAAGGLAKGGATFSFQRGPDGKQYAIGGEVNIDTAPVSGNPEATIRKAQQIRAAALAPANPSAQDRAVAASASALEAQAQQELKNEEQETPTSEGDHTAAPSSPRIDLFV